VTDAAARAAASAAAGATGGTLVTAIVAAYNEERHLGECLASLRAQTYAPLEILVVDDGSTDGTAAVAAGVPGVRLASRPHTGKARSVNAAAEAAKGEILLFLDGDLVFASDYVALLVAPILSGEAVGTCHGTELVANPENRWAACWQARAGLPTDRRQVLTPEQLAEGSIVYRAVRRSDFLRVGGFDDIGFLDDQTLFPKLGRRARCVPEAVCRHYNPERLGEVYASGVWGAQSILHLHGRGALVTYFPLFGLFRAVRAGVRTGSLARVAYDLVYEMGIFRGLLRGAGGGDG
jgi:glycosyltransferase involved in cell wall biosynthesis